MTQSIVLIVTRRCNLECSYCPVRKDDSLMSPATALAAVRGLDSRGGGLVRLTGGEPTLNWKTVDAVIREVTLLRGQSRQMSVELCTNGTLLDAERIERCGRDGVTVVVSLDGSPGTMSSSGRRPLANQEDLLRLPGVVVTQTVSPQNAGRILDDFLHLWNLGARRLNFLPVYYVPWSARQLADLRAGFEAIAGFLGPRLSRGEAAVRNLERSGSMPLFNDDLTVDTDGTVYTTNLVMADSITAPLLDALRASGQEPPSLPPDILGRLEKLLDPAVRRSIRSVDRALTRFVEDLRATRSVERRVTKPVRAGRPPRLEFHISYACTNSCTFCSEAHRMVRWAGHAVTAMEIRRTLLAHARAGGDHVNFTGGEPTLHPAFLYAIKLARSLGMRIYVGTNGVRLGDPDFAREALRSIDELSLSIHGSTAHVHDAGTCRNGSFADLMRTRENVAAMKPEVDLYANVVATRLNVDDLSGIIGMCLEMGILRILISNVAPEGRALEHYGELAVPLVEWWKRIPDLVGLAERAGATIRFFGLPLCVLGQARMKSNDLYYDPRITVERARGPHGRVRLSSVITRLPRRGRIQTRRCTGCSMRGLCGGVFACYVDLFGDEGLEAVRG